MEYQTIKVTLPVKDIQQLDVQATMLGISRSEIICAIVQKQFSSIFQWQEITKQVRANYTGRKLNDEQLAEMVRKKSR